MEPHTRDLVRKLIDDVLARGNECEFLHQFALPLPSTIMSGLLGVDPSMTETFAPGRFDDGREHGPRDPGDAARERLGELAKDAKDMEAYLLRIEERQAP